MKMGRYSWLKVVGCLTDKKPSKYSELRKNLWENFFSIMLTRGIGASKITLD